MPDFSYTGRDFNGKLVSGHVTAKSESDVLKLLLNKNVTPLDMKQRIVKTASDPVKKIFFAQKGVKLVDVIMFCRQMTSLIAAGLPIVTSIARLAESTKSSLLRESLLDVSRSIAGGKSLSLSLVKHPKVFTPIFVCMVKAGEETGHLGEAFKKLTDYLELELSIKKRIKAILRYPMIVIIAIVVAVVVINMLVIPAFAKMFKSHGAALPLPTKILLATSQFFLAYWPYMIVAMIGIVFVIKSYIKTSQGRYLWDRCKIRVPLFGPIIMQVLLMRFSSLFTMVFRSGIPITAGMGLVANAVGNLYLRNIVLTIRNNIERGESLLNATMVSGLFPPLVIQMISVGEESGTLDTMLEQVSDFYEREVDYDIKRLGDMMEPILIVIVAAMVLIVALGVFLPMWNMTKLA